MRVSRWVDHGQKATVAQSKHSDDEDQGSDDLRAVCLVRAIVNSFDDDVDG